MPVQDMRDASQVGGVCFGLPRTEPIKPEFVIYSNCCRVGLGLGPSHPHFLWPT